VSAVKVIQGDCRKAMAEMPAESFHAIVTDPPYELGFMGKKWDNSGIAYDKTVWIESLRVLKPGGYLLAFGGSRTYHRLACAIEDAGFEIRDMIEWIYGQGFPKSLDVSKAMDKDVGAVRKVIGTIRKTHIGGSVENANLGWQRPSHYDSSGEVKKTMEITEAETADAKLWRGYGTALKPAHEPICVARKPLIGTVVENIRLHGTGAINIDGCRIGMSDSTVRPDGKQKHGSSSHSPAHGTNWNGDGLSGGNELGRFPSNLILDSDAAAALDEQSGHLQSGQPCGSKRAANQIFGKFENKDFPVTGFGDAGGASRFFYTAKASGTDRGNQVKGAMPLFGVDEEKWRNSHPTVKPQALMRYLLKLVCPPGSHVLDPFFGSGTTGVAAKELGIDCTGIELLAEHIAIINERLKR
jgi:hypothetical protein